MKHFFVLFLLLTAPVFSAFSVRCVFDYRIFYAPDGSPFAEVILGFEGRSIDAVPVDSAHFQASVQLTFLFSQEKEVKFFKKVDAAGPVLNSQESQDFMAIERFALPAGAYDFELEILDLSKPTAKPEVLRQSVNVPAAPTDRAWFSDVQFISAFSKTESPNAFSKSGVDMLPYLNTYFPSSLQVLVFYTELYGTAAQLQEGSAMVVSSFIKNSKGTEVADTRRMKREKATAVLPILQTIDISLIETGAYTLVVELRNRENEVIAQMERPFSRVNVRPHYTSELPEVNDEVLSSSFVSTFTGRDSLWQIIQALHPIADNSEQTTIRHVLPDAELKTLQSFFYTFWWQRNNVDPLGAWLEYQGQLAEVNRVFGTRIKKGWQTDRGRVYLQYGPPNTRVQRPHLAEYWPFEIWHYYETNNKLRNARFLFIDTSLSGDYELLHSDAPNEVKNYDWKNLARNRTMNSPSATNRTGNLQQRDPYSRDLVEDLWYNPY